MERLHEALRRPPPAGQTSTWPDVRGRGLALTGESDAKRHDGHREAENITLKHIFKHSMTNKSSLWHRERVVERNTFRIYRNVLVLDANICSESAQILLKLMLCSNFI